MKPILVNMREEFMMLAIEKAWEGVKTGQEPFGSCVVRGVEVLSSSHNTIRRDNDPTAHAEMNVIREACRKIGSPNLSGCEIYATFKPCDMCIEAIKRAGIKAVYYGAGPEDVEYPSTPVKLNVESGILRDQCLTLASVKYHPL
jgi:tRNA(Arg) A34 adenosine deaminase TadA